jgi:methyl-accepting chemotaxis protein
MSSKENLGSIISSNVNSKKVKKLSAKLISFIIPIFAVGILAIMLILFIFVSSLVKNLLYTSLQQQVLADAGQINRQLNSIFYYLNGVGDTLETIDFENDNEINEYMATTVSRYDMIPTGSYLGLRDGTYIDPTGWELTKPVSETGWYKQGIDYTNKYFYYYDVPYFDSDTGDLCATVIRHVTLKDGRDGVFAADLMMSTAQEYLNSVSIYDSGHAMMLTSDGLVLSYIDDSVCGQNAADITDDKLVKSIATMINSSEDGEVEKVRGNDGQYYVIMQEVSGTDWKVVDYAPVSDVLSSVIYMVIVVSIIIVILLIGVGIVLATLIGKMIRKPVSLLTDNIGKIANGDFTTEIMESGNDEIAFMNSSMKDFIDNMRNTIKEIQTAAKRLDTDSERSRETSELLSREATEQSQSMEQILDNMEGMANAVTEVAENATELAQTVAELTEAEQEIETSMNELVERADAGQKDMSKVSVGMSEIVSSMNDMNSAVQSVDEAAEQINQIIDMINNIASQTNLLSLNASIEAARAGEAGKGFAVVATEIGQLANNSSDATKQIADIIQGMTLKVRDLAEKSENNTKLINDSAESITTAAETFLKITEDLNSANVTLTHMANKMNSVNDVATNMASVSEEQSASTQEITDTVNKLTESSKNVAESSRTVSDAAGSVADAVNQINDNISFFRIDKNQAD